MQNSGIDLHNQQNLLSTSTNWDAMHRPTSRTLIVQRLKDLCSGEQRFVFFYVLVFVENCRGESNLKNQLRFGHPRKVDREGGIEPTEEGPTLTIEGMDDYFDWGHATISTIISG
ncbi:hypothetical protein KIN20_022081 [Parelaphostrongylus tenuis]|uniref:Uncharacterized protein n=1 Tax=Parelaphostrongylus tenuis TaxID=148309 RepID=A0AAD5MQ46_PARTN|nr:hypothetical protein KIN20_022081 [Parelaphostrongylus tenuis]